jgi:drug/metabolite transporter (DMT)-like permease
MCLIWGIPYLLIKVAVQELSPVTLVLLRTGIGAVLLLPIAAARGELRALLPRWRWVLAYTVAEVTLPWLFLAVAEQRLSSSLTGLLIAAVPLVGALALLVVRADDRVDLRRAIGLVVGFAGVAALLGFNDLNGDLVAIGEIALVVLGYAVGPMIVARRLSDVPATGVIAVSLALTALVYVPLGLMQLPSRLPSVEVVGSVLVLGVVCTAVAFLLFFRLIAEAGPARAQVITYVNPAVALALGVLLLGEPFTVGAGVGFALILAGLLLATYRRSAKAGRPTTRPQPEDPEPLDEAAS